jgi:hypothetical protein
MALKNLKLKLKTDLKKTIEETTQGRKDDPRVLNYFDLKDNEKMTILFMPDINGELWAKWRTHNAPKGARGIKAIRCLHEATGGDCPACQQGFKLNDKFKETGDKSYKDEAKNWWGKDRTVMSCLVLDAPFEIPVCPDKNEMKLFFVPYAVEAQIKNAIVEGEIDEEMLFQTPFVIKKTKNKGGYASYEDSYFSRKVVSDDDLEYFEDRVVEQYDYETLDLITPVSTEEELEEWVLALAKKLNQAGDDDDDDDEPTRQPRNTRRSRDEEEEEADRPSRTRRSRDEEEEEEQEPPRRSRKSDPEPEQEDEPEEKERKAPAKTGGSLRDRLSGLR